MTLIRFIATSILMLSGTLVSAFDLTEKQNTDLRKTISAFEQATRENDFKGMFAVMPPKILSSISDVAGVSEEQLLQLMEQQMATVMEQAEVESFEFDLDGMRVGETDVGRTYALIPTQTVISALGTRTQSSNSTLALLENDQWYLMRIESGAQLQLLTEPYPDLRDIEFPESTTKILN